MLTFIGIGKIKPEKAKDFEKALQAYLPHLEAEEGTGRKNAPNHAFLNRTQEIKYE